MKARRVIESIGFERGVSPKASLDIGGIVIGEKYSSFYKEFLEKYTEWINSLIGKIIYGEMEIWYSDKGGGWAFGRSKKYRIKVAGIRQIYFSERTHESLRGGFEVEDKMGHWYRIYPTTKIWIENEG